MKRILVIGCLLFFQSSLYAKTVYIDCEGSWTMGIKVGWLSRFTENDSGRVNGKLIISDSGVDYRNNGALVARFYGNQCLVRDDGVFCKADGCDKKNCDKAELNIDFNRSSFLYERHSESNDGGMPSEREDQHEGFCFIKN